MSRTLSRRLARYAAVFAVLLTQAVAVPASHASGALAIRPLTQTGVALSVKKAGIYRIYGSFLKAHGISWDGLSGSSLALTSGGKAVPRYVSTRARLSDTSYLEFYGSALDTAYTSTNIYYLATNSQQARDAVSASGAPLGGRAAQYYQAQYNESRRTLYEPSAPGDPWFYAELESTGTPYAYVDKVNLPGLVPEGTAHLAVHVWGVTELPGQGPQHHFVAEVNGHRVAEIKFSGQVMKTVKAGFPGSWLTAGKNSIRFLLPGDVHNSENIDLLDVKTFTLTYRRAFVAEKGRLDAAVNPPGPVSVTQLRTGDVSIWRLAHGAVARLGGFQVTGSGHFYQARFGAKRSGTYSVSDSRALLKPKSVRAVRGTYYLLSGQAQMLVIGPPALTGPLQPLIKYHQDHGLTVKVANVADVYTRFTGGVFDAHAIQDYITAAITSLGTRSVLLVGADTYDYRRYVSCAKNACPANPGDSSYVPSLYARNDCSECFGQIPSDELYAGGSKGPRLAIGRIPATTPAQVQTVVTKTLDYLKASSVSRQAVFAAGGEDPEFDQSSNDLIGLLPPNYTPDRVFVSGLGAKGARERLQKDIDAGAGIVNFVGHGNLEQWGQPPALLTVGDIPHLASRQSPSVFFGWGCQTAYDVDPTDQALNARLLFAANGGAVLTLGSTGLDFAQVQAELAHQFFQELFHDTTVSTIGEALQIAENKALAQDPATVDPVLSYELFGDPALPVQALR